MQKSEIQALNNTFEKTEGWLRRLDEHAALESRAQAYSLLRAVLHAIRDRLTVDEAVDFASQMPMLVRGFYYEGWKPSLAPNDYQDFETFLERVEQSLHGSGPGGLELATASQVVFEFLKDEMGDAQMGHVENMLPGDVLEGLAA